MTIHIRNLSPQPATLDPEARTVEAIVSTGADVQRAGYIERLPLENANTSRLPGAPVLDAHRASSTRDQLGVVEAAEIRAEGLWVRIRLRSNTSALAILDDIQNGTIRGLSIGYTVEGWQETRERGKRVRIARRWIPIEVSIVPVPADPGAHFRKGELVMETVEQTIERPQEPQTETRAEANAEIRRIAETAGLTRAWADQQIDAEATAEEARRAAFEAMRSRSAESAPRTTRAQITFDHDAPEVVAERAGEALFARLHPEHELSPEARRFAGLRIPDLAREVLRLRGFTVNAATDDTVITRALHTTSDYPEILGNALGRSLRRSYEAAPEGARRLARQTTARDFRDRKAIMLGASPALEKVEEHGEYTFGTIDEAAESYRLDTFGKIFGISRKALVNDDLGAFDRIAANMGTAARAFEAAQIAGLIASNPTMSDGKTVFQASSHGNTSASSGSTVANITSDLNTARLAMRRQKGLAGEAINVVPKFVLVPPELETTMEQALSQVQATRASDTNPFASLSLIVDPRLTDTGKWYLAADPAQIDGLEYAYLEGAPGPQIETRAGFEVDGLMVKVRLDFGAGWIDWRGWYRVG